MTTTTLHTVLASAIFRVLCDQELSEYLAICSQHLPKTIRAHNFLLMQLRWRKRLRLAENQRWAHKIAPKCKYVFLAPKHGDKRNCTFLAVSEESVHHRADVNYAIVFTLQESCEELKESFHKTKCFNWRSVSFVISMDTVHSNALQSFFDSICLDRAITLFDLILRLPLEKAKNMIYTIPANVYVDRIREEHATEINHVWPRRTERSLAYIRSLILLNDGVGLFDRSTGELLSWVLMTDHMAPGCLQTKDKSKNHGFGKLVLKIFCKRFAERENLDLFAFVSILNPLSRKILFDIGFELLSTSTALIPKPTPTSRL